MLQKGGITTRVPVFDLCAWLYRFTEFADSITLDDLTRRFNEDYRLTIQEYQTIFTERTLDGQKEAQQGYFVTQASSDAMILELVSDVREFDVAEAISISGLLEGRSPVRATDVKSTLMSGRRQVVLQGPPGTGKTYLSKLVAAALLEKPGAPQTRDLYLDPAREWSKADLDRVEKWGGWSLIQFHPSYTYEDFVRGIATSLTGGTPTFSVKNRAFVRLCELASKTDKPVVLVIDEINRGDLSKIFGELTYALEYRGEPVSLQYASDENVLTIPRNLYLIGTMNTADHSIAHIDYAIRRRFDFIDVIPDRSVIESLQSDATLRSNALTLFDSVSDLVKDIPEAAVGHSFFLHTDPRHFAMSFVFQVLPLLADYRREGMIQDTDAIIVSGWPGQTGIPIKHERPFELVRTEFKFGSGSPMPSGKGSLRSLSRAKFRREEALEARLDVARRGGERLITLTDFGPPSGALTSKQAEILLAQDPKKLRDAGLSILYEEGASHIEARLKPSNLIGTTRFAHSNDYVDVVVEPRIGTARFLQMLEVTNGGLSLRDSTSEAYAEESVDISSVVVNCN